MSCSPHSFVDAIEVTITARRKEYCTETKAAVWHNPCHIEGRRSEVKQSEVKRSESFSQLGLSSMSLCFASLRFLSLPRHPLILSPSGSYTCHFQRMAIPLTSLFDSCENDKNLWFYEKIEQNRAKFESGQFTTTTLLEQKFQPWAQILQEDIMSLRQRSSGRRSIRNRVRAFARAIDRSLGSDVLLLCTLATSIDKTTKVQSAHLLQDLEKWWKGCSHPPLLSKAREQLCKAFPKANLMGIPPENESLYSSLSAMSSDTNGKNFYAMLIIERAQPFFRIQY